MTNYRRGYAAELRAKRLLERDGFTVIRAAGSHGLFDLCGLRADGVVLVQVKRGRGRLTRIERTNLHAIRHALPRNARIELWRFLTGKRAPLIEVI